MTTKPTYAELVEARKSRLANHRTIVTPEMEARNAIKVEQLRQMAIKESNSYFWIDLSQKKFTHIFSAHHPHLKHPTINVSHPDNLSQTNLRAHPDTLYFNLESDIMFYDLMMAQPFEQRKNFVSVVLRCLKNEKNRYKVWLFTTYVDECDVVGVPCSLIVKAECLDMFSTENFQPYRQFYLANETNPHKILLLDSDNKHILKGKELKVLELGEHGLTIEETAAEMCVDVTTIKSHRTQTMLKLNAPTFPLACMMAKKLKCLMNYKLCLINYLLLIINYDL